ncbi:6-phosphogluconolactonase [Porphyridium purpureum]|uniref:6-phosphogluconolactonase n=1 Tax=Porphyridium purpureum TaxID=35688 RepID=A0A5J4Z754_PORPP|nr:6-phosphogluconolactonase [Porphyridium purpureum]|eukprot:POR6162..scf295_1
MGFVLAPLVRFGVFIQRRRDLGDSPRCHARVTTAMTASRKLDVSPDTDTLSRRVADMVVEHSDDAIRARGAFNVAVSGGSLPSMLAKYLVQPDVADKVQWDKWNLFFADERCVPLDDDESNYKLVKSALLDRISIPDAQVFPIDPALSPEACAAEYQARMLKAETTGSGFVAPSGSGVVFDLVLLGMGPDGHTASLFPGHKLLEEHTKLVAHIEDSPKPPPSRITLTFPVLNAARCVAFLAAGSGKQEMMVRIHQQKDSTLPAQCVQPENGTLIWYMDSAAAEKLPANVA